MPDENAPIVQTIEKTPEFLHDLQSQANELRRGCRHIAKMVPMASADELVDYSSELQVMLKAYIMQVTSLAETRYTRESLEDDIERLETDFWKFAETCEDQGMGTPWQEFIWFVFEVLRVCQSFLEQNDLLLSASPVPEDFAERTWSEMAIEFRDQLMKRRRAEKVATKLTKKPEPTPEPAPEPEAPANAG